MSKPVTTLYGGEVELYFNGRGHTYWAIDRGVVVDPLPGVTTVIGVLDKPALVQWAANQTADYILQHIKPDTSYTAEAISKFCGEARFNFRDVKQEACDVGKIAHKWIEDYLTRVLDNSLPIIFALPENEQAANACNAFLKWAKDTEFTPFLTESKVYSRKYQYGGTADFFAALIKGKMCVFDWKTSKRCYPEYRLQLSAYAQAHSEMHGQEIEDRWLVRLGKDNGECEPVLYGSDTQEEDLGAFLNAKGVYLRMQQLKREERAAGGHEPSKDFKRRAA